MKTADQEGPPRASGPDPYYAAAIQKVRDVVTIALGSISCVPEKSAGAVRPQSEVTLRELALDVVTTYDRRLVDGVCMLAFGQAIEKMRKALGRSERLGPSDPDALPLELQVMQHISSVLGVLPAGAARHRVLVVVALALAPECFSEREYGALLQRAKGA